MHQGLVSQEEHSEIYPGILKFTNLRAPRLPKIFNDSKVTVYWFVQGALRMVRQAARPQLVGPAGAGDFLLSAWNWMVWWLCSMQEKWKEIEITDGVFSVLFFDNLDTGCIKNTSQRTRVSFSVKLRDGKTRTMNGRCVLQIDMRMRSFTGVCDPIVILTSLGLDPFAQGAIGLVGQAARPQRLGPTGARAFAYGPKKYKEYIYIYIYLYLFLPEIGWAHDLWCRRIKPQNDTSWAIPMVFSWWLSAPMWAAMSPTRTAKLIPNTSGNWVSFGIPQFDVQV